MADIFTHLKWRGFQVIAKNSTEGVLLPSKKSDLDLYYQLLNDYYFRRILADLVQLKIIGPPELKSLNEHWSEKALQKYWHFFEEFGFLSKKKEKFVFAYPQLDNFGGTFEWFLAQVLEREFMAQTLWSVRLEGIEGGGDFDVLALLGEKLFYLEGKSSPPNNVPYAEIEKFLLRQEGLGCDCAMIVSDTTLRIERNILDNLLYAIRKNFGINKEEASSLVKPVMESIYFIRPKIFILNTKRDLLRNLELTLHSYFLFCSPGFER